MYLRCYAEPEPVAQQERAAERPAAIPANTNIDDKQVTDLLNHEQPLNAQSVCLPHTWSDMNKCVCERRHV